MGFRIRKPFFMDDKFSSKMTEFHNKNSWHTIGIYGIVFIKNIV